jgi:hypothetical protein
LADDGSTDAGRAPEQDFVAFLAGDPGSDAGDIDPAALGVALARAFRQRISQEPSALRRMLVMLASRADAEPLLELLLPECWVAIVAALWAVPLARSHKAKWVYGDRVNKGASQHQLVHLVVRLAPDVSRFLSEEESKWLAWATAYDVGVYRHRLQWVACQPNSPAQQSADSSAPPSKWSLEAKVLRQAVAHPRQGWYENLPWAANGGASLATKMLDGLNGAKIIRPLIDQFSATYFESRLDCVFELATLSRQAARLACADPRVIVEVWEAAAPEQLGPRIRDIVPNKRVSAVLPCMAVDELEAQPLLAGLAIAAHLHRQDLPRTATSVAEFLGTTMEEVTGKTFCGVALLWADLRQIIEYEHEGRYKHEGEIRGVLARLSERLVSWPEVWVVSARELVAQSQVLGSEAMTLLTLVCARYPEVRDAVQALASVDPDRGVRDRAGGILARVAGAPLPGDELRRWLADSAARAFDGVPLFPHPLTQLARTWLGSTDVEDTMARALRQAMNRFSEAARQQGAAGEEIMTGVLLAELTAAFRDTSLRLEAGGRAHLGRVISVSQRPVRKVEEKTWGCDIALLLKATITPSVVLRLAELVQVKKSEAFGAPQSGATERWRIDVPQLLSLLDWSESACYWLILSSGELVCVTARWLYGLVQGHDAVEQKSVTIGYNEIRHTGISIEQFLPELFMGTWVGAVSENVLQFASGENSNIAPRHILEITVGIAQG